MSRPWNEAVWHSDEEKHLHRGRRTLGILCPGGTVKAEPEFMQNKDRKLCGYQKKLKHAGIVRERTRLQSLNYFFPAPVSSILSVIKKHSHAN